MVRIGSVRLRPRLLAVSVALGLVVAVGLGLWWGSPGSETVTPADDVVMDRPGEFTDATIALNEAVDGDPLPIVDLVNLAGDRFSSGELMGTPLVVNLWFADCPPCRRELPAFAAVHAEVGDRVRFVGINPRDDAERTSSFARERGVFYENYLDPDGRFLTATGIAAMPTTLLVSADGTILEQRSGEVDQTTLTRLVEEWFLR